MNYNLEEGELTKIASDSIWNIYDDEERNQYIKEPDNYSVFYDGVIKYIKCDTENLSDEEISKIILISAKEKGIDLDRVTLNNWIVGKPKGNRINPQCNSTSRESIYKLCFALELGYLETIDFFCKVYLSRPFDCRKINEAVYLFCFANNKSYRDYVSLMGKIKEKDSKHNISNYEYTSEFISKIEIIDNEQDLLNFIELNSTFFGESNLSALKEYEHLLCEAKQLAGVESNRGLLSIIENINFRKPAVGKQYSPKNSDFLKVARENFPQEITFSKIDAGKDVKYDALRKAIILLEFYIFCENMGNAEYSDGDSYDVFIQEINDLLISQCGFPPLYYRNPYDWIFGHCMICDDPLIEFQDIIADMLHVES